MSEQPSAQQMMEDAKREAEGAAAWAFGQLVILELLYRKGVDPSHFRSQEQAYLKAYAGAHDPEQRGSIHLLNGARRALRLFYLFHDVRELGGKDGPQAVMRGEPCTLECCSLWASFDRLITCGQIVGPQPGPEDRRSRPPARLPLLPRVPLCLPVRGQSVATETF
jgi:hypothetical protein